MAYGVKIVRDDDLPADVEWMFVRGSNGGLLLCLAHSSVGSGRVLAEAWAAFQEIHRGWRVEQPLLIAV